MTNEENKLDKYNKRIKESLDLIKEVKKFEPRYVRDNSDPYFGFLNYLYRHLGLLLVDVKLLEDGEALDY
jgi:hypothetical protein